MPGRLVHHDRDGRVWEGIAGYARALRDGERILVSGTTATHGAGRVVGPADAEAQAVYILDKIGARSRRWAAGSTTWNLSTRVHLRDAACWRGVAEVHGRYFGTVRPVNTMLGGASLIGDYEVEIEAEARVRG